jgi:hypothetical protein
VAGAPALSDIDRLKRLEQLSSAASVASVAAAAHTPTPPSTGRSAEQLRELAWSRVYAVKRQAAASESERDLARRQEKERRDRRLNEVSGSPT